jgi:phosphonate metabolism-associated iron-containing alcohol dehydrogenase
MGTSFHNPVALTLLPPDTWKQELLKIFDNNPKTLFIYSKSAIKAAYNDGEFLTRLEDDNKVTLLTGIESNPSINQLAALRKELEEIPNVIIALGGGSVIDMAKILLAFDGYNKESSSTNLLKAIRDKEYLDIQRTIKKLIAIPTTAGTGSELTRWATIWDTDNKKKFSVEREDLYPTTALVDPSLTVSMPKNITLSTGLDALSHAIEAYWSTKSNPIVRRLSAQAITQIVKNLRVAVDFPENIEARQGMCIGSIFAGLAFSQTRTTACHALSYPLTVRFGIPHGIAVSLTLMAVMRLNWEKIEEKELFLTAFGVTSIEEVKNLLDRLMYQEELISLGNYGVTQEDIESLLDDNDFMQARLGNNPIDLELQQIKKIYLDLL